LNKRLQNKLEKEIRVIPDFPIKGILFQDIFSITENPKILKDVVNELSIQCKKYKITKINNKVTIIVDSKPTEVGIDPYNKLIDTQSEDNRRKL